MVKGRWTQRTPPHLTRVCEGYRLQPSTFSPIALLEFLPGEAA